MAMLCMMRCCHAERHCVLSGGRSSLCRLLGLESSSSTHVHATGMAYLTDLPVRPLPPPPHRPIPISALPPTDLLEGLSAQESLALQSARSLLAQY